MPGRFEGRGCDRPSGERRVGGGYALGRTLTDVASARRLSGATESVELPEQVEAETQLRTIRNAYLECEALYRGLADPEVGARVRLELAHMTAAPMAE